MMRRLATALQKPSLLNWLMALLPVLVLGVVGWILVANWAQIVAFPWRIDPLRLLLVFVCHSVALASTFWAWQLMVARLGGYKDLATGFRFYYVSNLAKRLPTSLPYIGGRLVSYKQVGVSQAAILNCVLLETLLVGVAGVIVYLAFLPFYSSVPAGVAVPVAALGLGAIGLFLARPQALVDVTNWALRRFRRPPLAHTPARGDILAWVGVYSLTWLFAGLGMYVALPALSRIQGPGFSDSMGIATLSTLVSLTYLVVPGGVALKELTATALLAAWMPPPAALVFMLGYRLIQTVNDLLWALLALAWKPGGSGSGAAADEESASRTV